MTISGYNEVILTMKNDDFLELVKQFRRDRAPRYTCGTCGHHELALARFMEDDFLIGLAGSRLHGTIGPINYHYLVTCRNCGLTTLHDYRVLVEWAIENNLLKDELGFQETPKISNTDLL